MLLKRHAPAVALGAVLLFSGCDVIKEARKEASGEVAARRRLNLIFEALRTQGLNTSLPIQTATCQWWSGAYFIGDMRELGLASDGFTGWATQKKIQNRFGSYQIVSLTKSGDTWLATVLVDGRALRVAIPRGGHIKWVD